MAESIHGLEDKQKICYLGGGIAAYKTINIPSQQFGLALEYFLTISLQFVAQDLWHHQPNGTTDHRVTHIGKTPSIIQPCICTYLHLSLMCGTPYIWPVLPQNIGTLQVQILTECTVLGNVQHFCILVISMHSHPHIVQKAIANSSCSGHIHVSFLSYNSFNNSAKTQFLKIYVVIFVLEGTTCQILHGCLCCACHRSHALEKIS